MHTPRELRFPWKMHTATGLIKKKLWLLLARAADERLLRGHRKAAATQVCGKARSGEGCRTTTNLFAAEKSDRWSLTRFCRSAGSGR